MSHIIRGVKVFPREAAVWRLIAGGRSGKVIAHELSIEESTVKVHTRSLFAKVGVQNRVQLALRYHGIEF